MAERKRNTYLAFWVSEEENEIIHQKMEMSGIVNTSAYLRKMALDGYTVKLDLPELKEMVSLLRYAGNNLNQLTKRVHQIGRVYDSDMEELHRNQERIWEAAREIISKLSHIS